MRLRNGIDHGLDVTFIGAVRIEPVSPERFRQDQRGSVVYVSRGIGGWFREDGAGLDYLFGSSSISVDGDEGLLMLEDDVGPVSSTLGSLWLTLCADLREIPFS